MLLALFACLRAPQTPSLPTPLALQQVGDHGEVLLGTHESDAPTVLCLHGRGGGAGGWARRDKGAYTEALFAAGFNIVCPSSLVDGDWSSDNGAQNPDVVNIDGLLESLGLDGELFVVGHSQGGAIASRFVSLTSRRSSLAGLQISNASGLLPVFEASTYDLPTLFAYATCDPIVDASDVERSISTLQQREVPVEALVLDARYAAGDYDDCHEFIDVSVEFSSFFSP